MKNHKMLRAAARLLVSAVDMLNGYLGRELMRIAVITVLTIPACWMGLILAIITA